MEFFDSKDWLNREPPYAFQWDHLLFVLVGLAIGIFLAFFLRKRSKKLVKTIIISLWAFGTTIVLAYYIITYVVCITDPTGHPFEIDEMLPFHSCLMFMYVFPVAMFAKNKTIKKMATSFIVIVNMIIGFITLFVGCPPAGKAALSLSGVQSLIIHDIIVIVPFIMIVTGLYDIKKQDLKYGIATFVILSICMYIFDAIADCDYFFFYDGHTFPVFAFISENVPHIVWTLIVVTCYVLTGIIIHYVIIGIKYLVHKKDKESIELKEEEDSLGMFFKVVWYRINQKVLKFAMRFMNWKEPELLEGNGAVLRLPEFIKNKGINRVLVVTDKGLMGLHLLDPMFEELKKQGVEYFVYDGVQPNPTIPNIEECKDSYINNKCEGIIAFGGGSPMDCAKAAAARVVKPKQSVRKMRGYLKVNKKLPPFFAVPTTAGTGSEITLAAVVTDPETHEKNAIADPCIRPKYAVLDPALTVGLPPHITSTTGMDALTHAVEAYIGKSNVKSTIKYAEDATKLIHENLEKAYNNGKDMEARRNMLKASYYAGAAFTRAFVGYVHAIAHNLGGMYGTPHGLANAVILPYVLEWYGKAAYKRLAKLADFIGITKPEMTVEEKGQAFIDEIKRMNKAMNIPTKFDFIKEKDIPTLVKRALKEGNPGYPVPKIMNVKECEQVIRSLMA